VLVAGRCIVAALGWGGTVVIARQLSPTAWGGFSFMFSLLGIVSILTDLRIGRLVLREMIQAGDDAGDLVGSYVAMRTVLGLAAYGLAVAVVALGGYPQEVVHGTAVAGLVLILGAANASFDVFFQARLWLRTVALSSVAAQVVQLAATLAIAAGGYGTLVRFALPAVAFEVVALWWKLRAVRRVVRLRLRVGLRQWWLWTKEAAPLAAGGAMATIYFRIDSVMLSKLDSLRSVGLYNIGYKFSDLVGFLAIAVCTPTLTLMIKAWPHDVPGFRRAFRHAFILLTVAAIGLSVGFVGFARPLVELLYGTKFTGGAAAAGGLVLGQALHFVSLLCIYTLIAIGQYRPYVLTMLTGVVVNIGMNVVLIPLASYNGAAAATVTTELLVLGILSVIAARVPGVRPYPWRIVAGALVAGTLMAAVIAGSRGWLPWPLAAASAGLAYIGALAGLRVGGGLRALFMGSPELAKPADSSA